MVFKDYYKILGLDTNRVTVDEIKEAYRKQAKKYHPDMNIGKKENEEIFKDINEAYKVLSSHASRRKYDRMWNHNVRKSRTTYKKEKSNNESVLIDFFNMCFGPINAPKEAPKKKIIVKGENVQTEINISIEEAFRGKEQSIAVRTIDGNLKNLKVQLPPGIQNNEKIRLVGQGKPGQNGGKNGDLFIKIKINNDKQFKLEGNNIRTNLYLTPWEAALSTKVTIPGINEDITVFIPKGLQSGETITIENKGYRDGKGGRGDLILDTRIMIPKHLNNQELELFEKLNNISKFNPRNV